MKYGMTRPLVPLAFGFLMRLLISWAQRITRVYRIAGLSSEVDSRPGSQYCAGFPV